MNSKDLEKKLLDYAKKIENNFSEELNNLINELDPTINANEYSLNYKKRMKSDPFYYLKFQDYKREKALLKFNKAINSIGKTNGSRYYKKKNLNVGIIADEFLYNSFKDVVNLEYISLNDYKIKRYDFVIIASTWRGIDNSWEGCAHPSNKKRDYMIDIIQEFNQINVPTIFYSKEDPVNYTFFKSLALHCKYIFTSALEVVDQYKEYTGNDNVDVLQFGINPFIHNPVNSRSEYSEKFKDEIIFAGSWLSKYPVRMNETKKLFDAIKRENAPFTIIDRNLRLEDPRYQFPSEYIENLAPPMAHNKLMNLHKIIRWSINMNSVKYSQTMFANRVYELQAFGNILLSNYNTGINNLFPNVRITNTGEDFRVIYNTSETDIKELQAKGIRNVFKEHTTFHRINQIATTIGLPVQQEKNKILVVLESKNDENIMNFNRQIYKNKTAIYKNEMHKINLEDFDFITFFTKDYLYEEYYLEDMITAFKYADVDFVTKNNEIESHTFTTQLKDIYITMLDISKYDSVNNLDSLKNGYNLDDVEIIEKKKLKKKEYINKEKELSVIVPIHNNGTYLEEKCFASLKRSSSFDKMEIIFINDGSTDSITLKIIERLRRRHPDIVYLENEKGSGSASKPRNQGVRIATTEYITYLDPDNEAIGDGYHALLESIKNTKVDMVVGNIVKEDSTKRNGGRYTDIIRRNNKGKLYIDDPYDFLVRAEMRVQSIQALIVKKSVIIDNNIMMVEGAAGQDTMFYQELVLNAKNIQGITKYIHVYYAAVTGSVTNTTTHKFFEKYYILELERIPYLQKYNLLGVYLKVRFNSYIRQWYLPRLERVPEEFKIKAITKFLEIIKLYEPFNPEYEHDISKKILELKQILRNDKQLM